LAGSTSNRPARGTGTASKIQSTGAINTAAGHSTPEQGSQHQGRAVNTRAEGPVRSDQSGQHIFVLRNQLRCNFAIRFGCRWEKLALESLLQWAVVMAVVMASLWVTHMAESQAVSDAPDRHSWRAIVKVGYIGGVPPEQNQGAPVAIPLI